MTAAPSYPHDLFTDQVLGDPYEHYRALRDLGPVVWLDAHQMYAVARYAEARAVLGDPGTYCSGRGVALNDTANAPLTVVPDLVGWPAEAREHLLEWAAATFDLLGPLNDRAQRAAPLSRAMMALAAETAATGNLLPGSVGAGVIEAARRGELEPDRVAPLIVGYLAPSLDTTISAIGSAVWLLARYPAQRAALRADPALIPNVFNETLRLESPLRAFSRVTTVTARAGDVDIPAGARVVVLYASANRDERHFPHPDEFDITRPNAGEHLGFGWGVHGCAGQGLARMEAHALLTALAEQVDRIDLTAPATAVLNNLINARASVPVTVTPARTTGTGPGPRYAGAGG
jgi:cytochrome P450